MQARDILVTGGTGYLGRPLIEALAARGHRVHAIARAGSLARVPTTATTIEGDVLDAHDVQRACPPRATIVHLVGTPHPSPSKAALFRTVDLASILATVAAARAAQVAHLIYVSVAQPAPVMRAYVEARAQGEAAVAHAGLTATILRPWYVLGPRHRWPIALVPFVKLAEWLPPTREAARRLGFVTLPQMTAALVSTVEAPPPAGSRRTLDVPAIRRAQVGAAPAAVS
jgi:nucleoside-diphosphate-sugar epimerase